MTLRLKFNEFASKVELDVKRWYPIAAEAQEAKKMKKVKATDVFNASQLKLQYCSIEATRNPIEHRSLTILEAAAAIPPISVRSAHNPSKATDAAGCGSGFNFFTSNTYAQAGTKILTITPSAMRKLIESLLYTMTGIPENLQVVKFPRTAVKKTITAQNVCVTRSATVGSTGSMVNSLMDLVPFFTYSI